MATDKSETQALNPYFDVVMKGLNGLVDGEHYYDAADDAQFEFLYRFPGWAEVIHGRENLIAAYSGYGLLAGGIEIEVRQRDQTVERNKQASVFIRSPPPARDWRARSCAPNPRLLRETARPQSCWGLHR